MSFSKLDRDIREDLFRRALAGGQITTHYQPFVNSICQQVTGFEALSRWETKKYGWISPAEFLPLVEQCDLVDDFTNFVFQSACHAASNWQKESPNLRLAVNVSTAQFFSDAFVPTLARVLRRTNFSARSLELEFTEATLVSDPVISETRLAELSDLGVNIVIDDFGGNASSLGVLKAASFDRVKIDRSFIAGLDRDHADQSIVSALVNLCTSMNLFVTAVGVETPSQEDVLSELGCYEVQGFLHASAMSADKVGPFLQLRNSAAMRRQRCA